MFCYISSPCYCGAPTLVRVLHGVVASIQETYGITEAEPFRKSPSHPRSGALKLSKSQLSASCWDSVEFPWLHHLGGNVPDLTFISPAVRVSLNWPWISRRWCHSRESRGVGEDATFFSSQMNVMTGRCNANGDWHRKSARPISSIKHGCSDSSKSKHPKA